MRAQTTFPTLQKTVLDQTPIVLQAQNTTKLNLQPLLFQGPPSLAANVAKPRKNGLFNPSITRAPTNLCPRCAWIISFRVDALHQCGRDSPYLNASEFVGLKPSGWFKATAFGVYDANFNLLNWTWFYTKPMTQIIPRTPGVISGHGWPGASGPEGPPWFHQVYDVRLLSYDDHLLATMNCRACHFSVVNIHLEGAATDDGGVRQLRAWALDRVVDAKNSEWARGRNHAMFRGAPSRRLRGQSALLFQPWPGMVASFGSPMWRAEVVRACSRAGGRQIRLCGTMPLNHSARVQTLVDRRGGKRSDFGRLRLLMNESVPRLSKEATGGHRMSLTAHLVRVRWAGCSALIGGAHTHRAKGRLLRKQERLGDGATRRRRDHTAPDRSDEPFAFGYRYTHVWYALEPRPPYRVIATSREFCLGAQQATDDCESVQYISGLAVADGSGRPSEDGARLIMTYGVNDCESKVAELSTARLREMLVPVGAHVGSCVVDELS